tara:strand:- start:231 stop:464 length:234 start_codon:yes stop_codon:yes gene_type:complete
MDVRIFNKGTSDQWRITVDNETRLIAEDWDEVHAFMERLLLPVPQVRDMTAYEAKQAMVDKFDQFEEDLIAEEKGEE